VVTDQPGRPAPGSLVLALQRAAHASLHALDHRLAHLALTPSELNVLANLAGGPLPVSALAAATATKATTLTSILDRLSSRGYVARSPRPGDRRSFLIAVTATGQPVLAEITAALHDYERQALAAVSRADQAGFGAVISALTKEHA